jgi:hypothetical protein
MSKEHCQKTTVQFWKQRTEARIALDRERANAPISKKIEIAERLRKDALFIKKGRKIIAKP